MTWQKVALAAVLVASVPASGATHDPLRLAPRTDWVVDYAEERCSLHRGFGEDENSVNLRIDWFGPRPEHRVLMVGPAIPKLYGATGEIGYRLSPDAELRPGSTVNGTFLDQPAVSFTLAFLPHDPERQGRMSVAERMRLAAMPRSPQPEYEASVRSLEVRFSEETAFVLALGNMKKPLEALRACMDNLQSVWGLDPAVQRTLTRYAVPKPSTVRRVQRRYPSEMLLSGVNAFVPVRVMIDATGAVDACVVQSEGIEEAFSGAVCDGLARGYEPALDAAGNPVASVYPTSVFYLNQ